MKFICVNFPTKTLLTAPPRFTTFSELSRYQKGHNPMWSVHANGHAKVLTLNGQECLGRNSGKLSCSRLKNETLTELYSSSPLLNPVLYLSGYQEPE